MVKFEKFRLKNGLRVLVHRDKTTPLAVTNLMYNVGARDESPDKTGFAHLFEHLMFGGSVNIPLFDRPLEEAGGSNNAFTSNDITNYYITLPSDNLETAFWLESDRMLGLAFSEKSLNVQKHVVCEEFRQSYLNQPYGDAWLCLMPLAYKVHPYRWPTIGADIAHIENAQMKDVKAFFNKFYYPANAILVVAGNVNVNKVKTLAEKWFGPIPPGKDYARDLPKEPAQTESRYRTIESKVPFNALYKVFHMCDRMDKNYYASDILSGILSNGKSSRLYNILVKEKKLFSELHAYLSGSLENGLFVISGKLIKGVKMKTAEKALNNELDKIKSRSVHKQEMAKVKNKMEAALQFSDMNLLARALNLAIFELLGDAEMVNEEMHRYLSVTDKQVREMANTILLPSNCSTLYYYPIKKT